jgi:hypothetical protein
VYSVQSQHVGRRLACKKCGVALAVQADGINLAEVLAPAEPEAAEQPSTPSLQVDERELSPARLAGSRPSSRPPLWPHIAERMGGIAVAFDLATIAFGVGLVVLLLFFFLPLIDAARLAAHQAALASGQQRAAQQEREWTEQKDADESQPQRTRDARAKERTRLEVQVEEAIDANARAISTYRYGQLVGSLILTLASLAFLRPSQPTIRRIVGAGVLLAQVFFIFLAIFLAAFARG